MDDLREIVAYAKDRHIEIIPEIDLPGHMVAAVTAYPEFSCDPSKEYSVRIDGGISKDVLNIGKDEVVDFLKIVLDNVAEIFPYDYIHLGGDECPTDQWATDPDCLKRVEAENLTGVNELQSWLVELLGNYLKDKHNKETCSTPEQLEYQMLPRLLAIAEIGWLPTEKKSWLNFYNRLQSQGEILDALDYTYAKPYIEPKKLTVSEETLFDAKNILDESVASAVGFPSVGVYDALRKAYNAFEANQNNKQTLLNLQIALRNYKTADIVMPEEDKVYHIVSASTFYKKKYVGTTIYEKNDGLSLHYTPQQEPEELWQFIPQGEGYLIKNYASGKVFNLPEINKKATLTNEKGTLIRIDKATQPAQQYDYVPGAVTISSVKDYSDMPTGKVKRLFGNSTGEVFAIDDPMLCNPGTWFIVEQNN